MGSFSGKYYVSRGAEATGCFTVLRSLHLNKECVAPIVLHIVYIFQRSSFIDS